MKEVKGIVKVGETSRGFLIESGEVVVSDPCYGIDTWCLIKLDNIQNGSWYATTTSEDCGGWGIRTMTLHAYLVKPTIDDLFSRMDYEDRLRNTDLQWELVEGSIGVDSGCAGIFDKAHFQDPAYEDWTGEMGGVTFSEYGWGLVPYGVVSRSGYGDGMYNLYKKTFEGKIVALKVDFGESKGARQEMVNNLISRTDGLLICLDEPVDDSGFLVDGLNDIRAMLEELQAWV